MAEEVHGGSAVRTATRPGGAGPGRPAGFLASRSGQPHGRRFGRPTTALLSIVALVLVACAAYVGWDRGAGRAEPTGTPSGQAAVDAARPALRNLMPATVRIGSAVDGRLLATDARYREALAADFNAVTAENAMKWSNLQPAPGVYDWSAADHLVDFAQANGQAVYGHTLVWHSSVPSWVSDSWSEQQLRAALKQHVTSVVSRYRGKVWAWDVVNEVLDEDGTLRDSLLLRQLGPGYIADAFHWAHEADPDARLFLNEYGAEGSSAKADGLLRLVRDLRSRGVPVHGVGFQGHLRADRAPENLTGNLRRFAALGVSVAITELDVRIQLPATAEKLLDQALLYQHVLKACLSVPTCESFTVWGFTDASSWISSHYPGYGAACLYDSDLRPKPARDALLHELHTRVSPTPS
ncbi:endo-1,4-beta-xylanase [Micromonospora phytophila]|uniref:endo-1,4-beta-xylanase n=1 Tax=Micromonospora phytophila TaxID=709888 RepID=UPI00202F5600|nr:endo-1,4-beta-xylanase [Micromonospora phytophila]MCM0675197.1 endo-1,4-beta-xylanase [Micromonospora phytophila]